MAACDLCQGWNAHHSWCLQFEKLERRVAELEGLLGRKPSKQEVPLEICLDSNNLWLCTEPLHHNGPHRAKGTNAKIYSEWANP